MKKHVLAVLALIVFLAALDAAMFFLFSYQENYYVFSDSVTILFSAIAAVAAFYAFRYHGIGSLQGKALLYLFTGLLVWAVAEIVWALQEIVLDIGSPLVSAADLFYYAAYIPLIIGFYYIWRITSSSDHGKKRFFLLTAVSLLALFVGYFSVFPIASDPEMSIAEKIVTVGYPVLDIFIVSFGIAIISMMLMSRISVSWGIIVIGFLLSTGGDILYAVVPEMYISGGYLDLLWQISYLTMAIGFLYYTISIDSFKPANKPGRGHC